MRGVCVIVQYTPPNAKAAIMEKNNIINAQRKINIFFIKHMHNNFLYKIMYCLFCGLSTQHAGYINVLLLNRTIKVAVKGDKIG